MPQDDYVPKSEIGVANFDFSQVDSDAKNPMDDGVDLDAMSVDSEGLLQGVSSADIEKGAYRQPPPGFREFEVCGIEFEQKGAPITVTSWIKDPRGPNGVRAASYDSRKVRIRFCIPGDPNCQISDNFVLPPDIDRPRSLHSYEHGFGDAIKAQTKNENDGGWHAKKWKHFLSQMFPADPNGKMPVEATKPKNWWYYPGTQIQRRIKLEVTPPEVGKPYTKRNQATGLDETVTPTRAFSQVKMYSYKPAAEPPELVKARHAVATQVPQSKNPVVAAAQPITAEMAARDKKKAAV